MSKPEQGLRPLTWADGTPVTRGADGSEEVSYSQPVHVDAFPGGGAAQYGGVYATNGEMWVSLMVYPGAGATLPLTVTVDAQLSNDGVTFPVSTVMVAQVTIQSTAGAPVSNFTVSGVGDPVLGLFQTAGFKYYRLAVTPDVTSNSLIASCPGMNADIFPRAGTTNPATNAIAVANSVVVSAGSPSKYMGGFSTALAYGVSNTPITGTATVDVFARNYVFNGTTWDPWLTPTVYKNFSLTIVAGTPQAAWTPAAGKRFRVMGYVISANAVARILFEDNAAAATFWEIGPVVSGEMYNSPPLGNGYESLAVNNVLNLDASVNATVSGMVYGVEST